MELPVCKCIVCIHKKRGVPCPSFKDSQWSKKLLKECHGLVVTRGSVRVLCEKCATADYGFSDEIKSWIKR